MNTNEMQALLPPNLPIGITLITAGISLGLFVYAHRPSGALLRDLQSGQIDGWVFKPVIYYVMLLLSILFALAGVLRILKSVSGKKLHAGAGSYLEEINRAKDLRDSGAISEAEFAKIKADALNR